jgi:probable HAF family extracellular repeat protein
MTIKTPQALKMIIFLSLITSCQKDQKSFIEHAVLPANQMSKQELSYQFTALDVPSSSITFPYDVNNSGTIVGGYYMVEGPTHGFIFNNGQFTDVGVPNSGPEDGTRLVEMADNGKAAGNYFIRPDVADHPILRDQNGGITILPTYPGAEVLIVRDYNPVTGTIVGFLQVNPPQFHGFIYQAGQYNLFDVPGASQTRITGINMTGKMVGYYQVPGSPPTVKGFILNNGIVTDVIYPGARITIPWGINNSGSIVGEWRDQDFIPHGFIYRNGIFTSIDFPGASNTVVSGINDHGKIVGGYNDITRGFYAVPE